MCETNHIKLETMNNQTMPFKVSYRLNGEYNTKNVDAINHTSARNMIPIGATLINCEYIHTGILTKS